MAHLKAALLGPEHLPSREFKLGTATVQKSVPSDSTVSFKVDPIYSFAVPTCIKDRQPNLGLLFQRYAPQAVLDSLLATNAEGDIEKQALSVAVQEFSKQFHNTAALEWFIRYAKEVAVGSPPKQARSRWRKALAAAPPCANFVHVTLSKRAAISLANASPWENSGWAFHHVYGVPMIPGDSLKGLMRHYLEEELKDQQGSALLESLGIRQGDAEQPCRTLHPNAPESLSAQELANLLFGMPGTDGAEGLLAVYDAWPEAPGKEGWFALDVVTSHHQGYYTSEFGPSPAAASDCDNPKPVHFLTLRPGLVFQIALAPTSVAARKEADFNRQVPRTPDGGFCADVAPGKKVTFCGALVTVGKALVVKALQEWGIGAKTGTGYGRMQEAGQGQQGGKP